MRSRSRGVFAELGPHELYRIQFRSRDGKVKHMQTFLFRHKFLNHLAFMNRMTVQDQNQRSRCEPKDLTQKGDHFVSGERMPVRLNTQLDFSALRRNQQGTQQIETFVVGDTGPSFGSLPSPRPGPLQRRDHGKAAFIFQNEGRAQLPTLFLSWAALPPSSVPPPHRRVAEAPVADAGCSIPSAASRAKRRSVYNGLQTTPRSRVRSGPASSNLRHIRRRRPLDPKPFPAVSPDWR